MPLLYCVAEFESKKSYILNSRLFLPPSYKMEEKTSLDDPRHDSRHSYILLSRRSERQSLATRDMFKCAAVKKIINK